LQLLRWYRVWWWCACYRLNRAAKQRCYLL
jgi:hypothetical protein